MQDRPPALPTPTPPNFPLHVKKTLEWRAQPGPQQSLFTCPAEIICYGGAAYGGKTDASIVWAAQGYNIPGYKALILRRTFPELERHIINRAREIFPEPLAYYNQRTHSLTFPCGDDGEAILYFGYIEHDSDTDQYQGEGFTRIACDESTFHSERQIRQMLRYMRAPAGGMKCQMLLATNPIGPGYGWHWKLFWKGRKPYKLYSDGRWLSDNRLIWEGPESAENPKIHTCFIPAKYTDNKIGMQKDPGYPARLKTQEGSLAEALLEGRLDVVQNTALDFVKEIHTCKPRPIPYYASRWMSIDWGVRDKGSATWFAADERRVLLYRSYARPGKEVKPFAYQVAEKCKGEGIAFCVLSHDCFLDRGLGQTQADHFREVFDHYDIPLIKNDKNTENRLMAWREFLRTTPLDANRAELDYHFWLDKFNREGPKAMSEYRGMLEASMDSDLPRLQIFQEGSVKERDEKGNEVVRNYGASSVIETIPLLVVDPEKPRKLAEGQDDHDYDSGGAGLQAYMGLATLPEELIYRFTMKGRMPDSPMAADLLRAQIKEATKELAGDFAGVPWRSEKFKER